MPPIEDVSFPFRIVCRVDTTLDAILAERLRWVVAPNETVHGPGEFVLYWMHNAVRGHENPALDVAICLARQNGLPLLVYHGLCETYPFASDRHHAFILQGARDVQRELAGRGIRYVFHLQRHGGRGPHLRDLTRRAAVLITEEMPVPPLTLWVERLQSITSTPIGCVDASCLLPVTHLPSAPSRAFRFREQTKGEYSSRARRPYVEQPVDVASYEGPIPFEPLDLQPVSLAELIRQCRIDHSVAPVADTPGGTRAGYARWEAFKADGLGRYAARRNDASDHGGVSRMSAYLHYGMVSPFRIAREADAAGCEKYLDELLVWRELSFHFCHHAGENLDTLDAVPSWARETLREHAADEREFDYSWETLARGRSGDPVWDACQRSLVRQGELHNNVRMTWGKAFLGWADSPGRALHLSIDLNHRYALDGRDPNSYGGVLWCFGLFDRPFDPPQPITGRVRGRPLSHHRRRIDMTRFRGVVDRPIAADLPSVAVVGAGIGGLTAARTLTDHGLQVTVFEKSRGAGGRMATRHTSDGLDFDHGAQYFTGRDPRFVKHVQSWVHDGIVAPWLGRIVELGQGGRVIAEKTGTPRYVGAPSMNAIARHLASDLDTRYETEVAPLTKADDSKWVVRDRAGVELGRFDVVILNAPAPQTAALLTDVGHDLAASFERVGLRPCWAVMLQPTNRVETDYDAAFVNDGPLSWIARNDRKPGRVATETGCWVLHASAEWSQQHLESSPEEVAGALIDAFEVATGVEVGAGSRAIAHRWRFADPIEPLDQDCVWDAAIGLGVCGDWCGGPRVEGAFQSGTAVAGAVLRHLTIDRAPASRRSQPTLFQV